MMATPAISHQPKLLMGLSGTAVCPPVKLDQWNKHCEIVRFPTRECWSVQQRLTMRPIV